MEKEMKRAVRRAHIARLKKARKNYWGYSRTPYGTQTWDHPECCMSPKQLGAVVQHPQSCSCLGCGNARRWYGNGWQSLTQQELSQREIEKVDLADLGSKHEQVGTKEED